MSIEEVILSDYNLALRIKSINGEDISDFLSKLTFSEGISKIDYEDFLKNNLLEPTQDYLDTLDSFKEDRDKIDSFSMDVILAVYDVNPGLDPSKIVIVDNQVLRKTDAVKSKIYDYLPLPLNPKWSTMDGDWRHKLANPDLVNEVVDEIWTDLIEQNPTETYCKVYIDALKINIPIREVGEDMEWIIKTYIENVCKGNWSYAKKHKFNYTAHLAGVLIVDSARVLEAMQSASFVLAFSEQVLANLLYKAIVEINPALKWESINWNAYKTTKPKSEEKRKPGAGTPQPKIVSSKDVIEEQKKFSDVSHEDIRNLKDRIKKRLIGQDAAVDELCDAINVARVGLNPPQKPIGVFLFIGPTGVGKTELTKVLAEELTDGNLIHLNMSEYQMEHEVAKLYGSPPGFVGFSDSDDVRSGKRAPLTLANKIRKTPFCVCNFDELEKAHEKVYNVLLGIFDEGFIESGRGDKCSFNQSIITATSNVGLQDAMRECESNKLGFGEDCRDFNKITKDVVDKAVRDRFKPEFRNRLTKIIYFNSLSKEACLNIVEVLLDKLKNNLEKNQQSSLKWTSRVCEWVIEEGFDEKYGARNLERTISTLIALPLANDILEKGVESKSEINLDYIDGKLKIDYNIKEEEKNECQEELD